MDIGFFPLGTGISANPTALAEIARHADANGMSTLWSAGHPFRVNTLDRPYPYAADGQVPVPATTDSYDQFTTLAFVAAITERIRLGTGVLVSSLLHPLELAKAVASIDSLSGGRFDLGIGVGWMKEEFDVLGVRWGDRARITIAGLDVAKRVWSEERTPLEGTTLASDGSNRLEVISFPKPVQRPHPPIVFGGTSEPALRRVGEHGDGWFAFCSSPEDVAKGRARIEHYARAAGRSVDRLRVTIAPGFARLALDDVKRFADAGADEVVVGLFRSQGDDLGRLLGRLTDELVEPAISL